jgi:hypothetical protein
MNTMNTNLYTRFNSEYSLGSLSQRRRHCLEYADPSEAQKREFWTLAEQRGLLDPARYARGVVRYSTRALIQNILGLTIEDMHHDGLTIMLFWWSRCPEQEINEIALKNAIRKVAGKYAVKAYRILSLSKQAIIPCKSESNTTPRLIKTGGDPELQLFIEGFKIAESNDHIFRKFSSATVAAGMLMGHSIEEFYPQGRIDPSEKKRIVAYKNRLLRKLKKLNQQ